MITDTPKVPERKHLLLAYGLLGFTMIIWASAFAGIRVVLKELTPLTLTTIRMLIAAIALGGLGAAMRIKIPKREDLLAISVAGLTGFSLYHIALNFALVRVTAGQASFLVATTPIWTAILAWRFLKEDITLRTWIGLIMGVVGVGVMTLKNGDMTPGLGSMLALSAGLCSAVNIIIQKNLLRRYKAIELSIYVTLAGTLPFFFYAPVTVSELSQMSIRGWLITLYLGLVPIALGYVLSIIALSILPANRSAQMLLLLPPIAAVIAWLWIGETPGLGVWIGGLLILLGVFMGGAKAKKQRPFPVPSTGAYRAP